MDDADDAIILNHSMLLVTHFLTN